MTTTMNKQRLIETQLFNPKNIIKEGKEGTPKIMVEGILATVDTPNGNGRYYSKELWEREINKYIEGPVKERRSSGELDHSNEDVVNLKNVSHLITEIWWEGKDIKGKIEVLPTPSGKILSTLLENNVLLGISSRGLGSVEQRGELLEVQDDFSLICWDFVSTPSNTNSWMEPIKGKLNESKNYLTNLSKYQRVNKIVNNIIHNL